MVPVFQNEDNLKHTIECLLSLRERLAEYNIEIVFVDDGSTDRSLDILITYMNKYPNSIRIIKLTRNFGQTPAIQAGLRNSKGDCVGIISADLQEPYELFADMLREWEKGAMLVIGEREVREEGRWHKMTSGIYWNIIKKYVFHDFPDMGYDFCLMDRQVAEDINRINEKNSSIFVLIYWLGYRPVRLPIVRKLRERGKSQWHLWKKIKVTIDTLIGFTYFPARIITLMGLIIASLCILSFIYLFIQYFLLGLAPPGWTSLVGMITLFSAMILFSLGIVSEYLLRILDEARKRPLYVIERFITKKDIKIERHDK